MMATMALGQEALIERLLRQHEVEQFLYNEAELLCDWKLMEWLDLFTEDGVYAVPPLEVEAGDPVNTPYIIYDEAPRRASRARQLLKLALVERPRSRIRRLLTNVRVEELSPVELRVRSSFHVHRSRRDQTYTFVGEYQYLLVRVGLDLKIRERIVILDQEFVDQGHVNFII